MIKQQLKAAAGMLLVLIAASCAKNNVNVAAPVNEAGIVKGIEKLGGKVTRDENHPDKLVIGVNFSRTLVTDKGLKEPKDLKGLQTLDLSNCFYVRDAALKELKELRTLQTLNLNSTPVTDVGLKELKELRNLQILDLRATNITDAGLNELKELNSLLWLYLTERSQVTEAGLRNLQKARPGLKIVFR
jgi:hypothetical protein